MFCYAESNSPAVIEEVNREIRSCTANLLAGGCAAVLFTVVVAYTLFKMVTGDSIQMPCMIAVVMMSGVALSAISGMRDLLRKRQNFCHEKQRIMRKFFSHQ